MVKLQSKVENPIQCLAFSHVSLLLGVNRKQNIIIMERHAIFQKYPVASYMKLIIALIF